MKLKHFDLLKIITWPEAAYQNASIPAKSKFKLKYSLQNRVRLSLNRDLAIVLLGETIIWLIVINLIRIDPSQKQRAPWFKTENDSIVELRSEYL